MQYGSHILKILRNLRKVFTLCPNRRRTSRSEKPSDSNLISAPYSMR